MHLHASEIFQLHYHCSFPLPFYASRLLRFRGKDLCYYMRGSVPLGLKRHAVQYSAWNRRRTHLVVVKHPSTRIARVSQRLQRWHQNVFTSKLWNSNTEMYSDRLSKKIAITFVKLSGGTLNFQWDCVESAKLQRWHLLAAAPMTAPPGAVDCRSLYFHGKSSSPRVHIIRAQVETTMIRHNRAPWLFASKVNR